MSSSGRKKYLTDLERNLERMEHIKRRITQCQSFGDEEKNELDAFHPAGSALHDQAVQSHG